MPPSQSSYQTLECDIHDGIQTVSLNRGKANPMNHQMVMDLRDLIHSSNQDPEIRGSILTGKPGFFSAGLDVIELYSSSYSINDNDQSTLLQQLQRV